MTSYILSKSTYIRGLQCLKSLYLNKHRPFLRDKLSEEQLAKFACGHSVGKLAQQLFPGGIEIPRPGSASAAKTQDAIRQKNSVIYEACFIHKDVIIATDILTCHEGRWVAYEVKSSGVLSETYYRDAQIQRYVMAGSGLELEDFFLIHRDLDKTIDESIPVNDLFIFTKVPHLQVSDILELEERLTLMKETLARSNSPEIPPGNHCMNPYPCDFRGHCWKNLTSEEVNLLNGSRCG